MKVDDIRSALRKFSNSKTVIVCIGNILKGDDGTGPVLYEKLKGKISCDIIDAGTVPENYIQTIVKKNPGNVLVIDSVDFGGVSGEIKIFKDDNVPEIAISTHVLSPKLFFDAVKSQCQADIFLVGIQPESTALNQKLSDSVNKSVTELAKNFINLFPG